ncbi:hypothetical protein UA08_02292 [Talaromyces atroroseus]|uniref:Uncharacterized protein n=1 Tax=Talaromyces atroroseus TaxID=1441469 RepID=A0A225B3H5_TALAT|nr:hypothetical protein UA08_02292 [Talaromyces atroroseus]OKL61836.1 hypothetical protein UA08_02292 [Talaromyces atroroseus]
MAEFVSAIGTIAAMAQMAEYAAKASLEFYDFLLTIKNAPREVMDITRDIQTFNKLVCNLQSSLNSPAVQEVVDRDVEISNSLQSLEEPITNCCDVFNNLMAKMRPHLKEEEPLSEKQQQSVADNVASAIKPSRRISRGSVKWYFKRREVYQLVGQLERTKSTFADAMGSITLLDSNNRTGRLLTLKSSALKSEPSSFALSSASTLVANDGTPFDSDAGTALLHFAETASVSNYSVSLKHGPDATEPKQPELHRNNTALTKLLMQSVQEGSISDTRDALKVVHVDSQDADGRTALSFAAELGRLEIAELLISQHASVSIRQYTNKRRAKERPHFLQYGGRTPLHWAADCGRPNIVRLLLRNGANPNARSTSGRSPLQEAAMRNRVEVIKILLENGADINSRSFNHGWTPMHEAGLHGHKDVAQLLSENGAWLDPLTQGQMKTPLHCAMIGKQAVVAKMLLEWGSSPNAQMFHDIVPLHIAAAGGWVVGIEMLLKSGALVNSRDALLHETPLHKAARNLETKAIDTLRKHGANEEARNVDGQTYRDILACAREAPEFWSIPVDDPSFYR